MSVGASLCEACCRQMTAQRDAPPHEEMRLRETRPKKDGEDDTWEEREYGCIRCGSVFDHVTRAEGLFPAWWLQREIIPTAGA